MPLILYGAVMWIRIGSDKKFLCYIIPYTANKKVHLYLSNFSIIIKKYCNSVRCGAVDPDRGGSGLGSICINSKPRFYKFFPLNF
jgi:hypothetical protein